MDYSTEALSCCINKCYKGHERERERVWEAQGMQLYKEEEASTYFNYSSSIQEDEVSKASQEFRQTNGPILWEGSGVMDVKPVGYELKKQLCSLFSLPHQLQTASPAEGLCTDHSK